MQGHTERATINRRVPLSKGMRNLLTAISKRDIPSYGQSQADSNRFRALMDRGYAFPTYVEGKEVWRITDAGKAAL